MREMTSRDLGAAAELSGQLGYRSTRPEVERRFRDLARDPDGAILVADDGEGKVLGWIHVCGRRFLVSDPVAEILGLVVDAGARRQGIGRALLREAEKWARGRGYSIMRIRSNMKRAEAKPFYEGMGYQVIKSQWVFQRAL